jgi:N-acetyl-anhydromuramyl-L-alanine amidase AmpD
MSRALSRTGLAVTVALSTMSTMTAVGLAATPAGAAPAIGRQAQFADAARAAGVPERVLLAVSYLESRWDTNRGAPSTGGGYGPMDLTVATPAAQPPAAGAAQPEDARGDTARPALATTPAVPGTTKETLAVAAGLTGADPAAVRTDPAANIRAGAALLAREQQQLGGPLGTGSDPADWYGAVARYSTADTDDAAKSFADEVYATMREGADRITDDGFHVVLPATAGLRPVTAWLARAGLRHTSRPDGLECPADLSCEWIPATYQQNSADPHNYANHDLSDRPGRQKIEYIVIHDTEGPYDTTINLIQDPTRAVSWNYTVRSSDGHIAQHVKAKDVAWHAGNWYLNAKAIGIEHEGYGAEQGAWFTEAMYRASARLVRYLAAQYGIPLDRNHIIGHDNVPGTVPATVAGMHWDPGPYWDWDHYFELLHAPFRQFGTEHTGLVTMDPDYAQNQPAFTGCDGLAADPCPLHGSTSVILHTAPSATAPLLSDLGLHPDGSPSTMGVADHGSRAETGQTYAVAGRAGDWTAIWYLGQRGWFYNPPGHPAAKWSTGLVAVPRPGRATVPVYGRAYPEQAAYPAGVPYQPITPLQYTFAAGQRYAVGNVVPAEYYRATTFDGSSPGDWTVIRGSLRYVQVQFGHRIAYVNLDDVLLLPSIF